MNGGISEAGWVSLIALLGWLILMLGSYRSYRMGASKTVKIALTWAAIFVGAALFFSVIT